MCSGIKTLPLFRVIAPANMEDKGKRNVPEERVHKSVETEGDDGKACKSFGGNVSFHKIRKHGDEVERKPKVKRKYLMKENNRLSLEIIKLTEQLSAVKELLDKKDNRIGTLKEKLNTVQNVNDRIVEENNRTKIQFADLLTDMEKQKTVTCLQCEELKEIIRATSEKLDESQKRNKEQTEDVNMLKNVVYRLNVQLERYQEKFRKPQETTELVQIDGHSDHNHTPVSWGNVNVHTLAPLLDAYQNAVKEKEDIIQKYEEEFSAFTGQLKAISDENETLHKKNLDDSSRLKNLTGELNTVRSEMKTTKEQNQLLIKKCALKHDKLQEVYKIYEHKISSMRRDYEVLQEQYHRARAELSSVTAKQHALVESYETLKADRQTYIPLVVHNTSVNECKRLFEELKSQYDTERTKFMNELKQLEEKIPLLESQIIELSADKQELQIKSKTSEKQLKRAEQKLTEVQATLSHVQVSRDSCKRQLGKAIEFGKDLIKEQESLLRQLSSRSKESRAAIRYGNSIISQMDSLKMQLKSVQKDAFEELATVEQRITDQDLSMESLKKEHELEITHLIKEIRAKDNIITTLMDGNAPTQPYLLYRDKIFSNTC